LNDLVITACLDVSSSKPINGFQLSIVWQGAEGNIRLIKSRRMRWGWHVKCMEDISNAYKVLVGKSEGK
jgi:hypothetical protein